MDLSIVLDLTHTGKKREKATRDNIRRGIWMVIIETYVCIDYLKYSYEANLKDGIPLI